MSRAPERLVYFWRSPRADEAIAAIAEALASFARVALPTTDALTREEATDRLSAALHEAVVDLGPEERGEVVGVLSNIGTLAIGVARSDADEAIAEASLAAREEYLRYLHEQFDSGERELVWPPLADTEWDEFRVMVGQYMERRRDEWPEIAFTDQPPGIGSVYSAFDSVVSRAQFFLSTWLQADSRASLIEQFDIDEAHLALWERYLQLSPKR